MAVHVNPERRSTGAFSKIRNPDKPELTVHFQKNIHRPDEISATEISLGRQRHGAQREVVFFAGPGDGPLTSNR
jgi:hypothetical protein